MPMAADLFGDIEPSPRVGWRGHLPGLTVTVAGTLAAAFLAARYGVPLTLMALLIGLALNFLSADARLIPGLAFASRSLLRWGIVLVGVRVTFAQVAALGPAALLAVATIVAATIGVGILTARRLGQDSAFGVLAGGSVAICGASAAMAIAALLGERRAGQAQLTLVLVGIAAASAAAMVAYPQVAHALALSDLGAGFMLGASIHDVAQALGGLDGVVNVAGGFVWEPLGDGTIDSWDRMYRINLRTAALSSRAALAHLGAGGAIVNVGAAGAVAPGAGMAPYAASKAGVMALTESLADEVKPRGIRVNAVLPTILDTPANHRDMPDADTSEWVKPASAARVIAFLLSPDAGAVTGAGIRLSLAG